MYTSFDIVLYSKYPKFHLNSKVDEVWDILDNLEYELSPAGEGFLGQLNTKSFIVEQKVVDKINGVQECTPLIKTILRSNKCFK